LFLFQPEFSAVDLGVENCPGFQEKFFDDMANSFRGLMEGSRLLAGMQSANMLVET
jgi:hypothetical protein